MSRREQAKKHMPWAAMATAFLAIAGAITEYIRASGQDDAHAMVAARRELELEFRWERVEEELGEIDEDHDDMAEEIIRLRETVASLNATMSHLLRGSRRAAREENAKVDEMLEDRHAAGTGRGSEKARSAKRRTRKLFEALPKPDKDAVQQKLEVLYQQDW